MSYISHILVTLVAQIAGMNSVEIYVYSEARESNEVNINAKKKKKPFSFIVFHHVSTHSLIYVHTLASVRL